MNIVHSQDDASWRSIGLLWGTTATAARGPRPRFSVEAVAKAGIALADADGLAAVTLARVAASLDLTTTALYRYVDAKETLVELMVDVAAGPPPASTRRADWRAPVRVWTTALWDCYRRHPWLTDVKPAGFPRCPNGMAWVESLLTLLDGAPVRDPLALVLQINLTIRGYAALAAGLSPPRGMPDWFVGAMQERFPRVVAAGAGAVRVEQRFWTAMERLLAAEDATARRPAASARVRRRR